MSLYAEGTYLGVGNWVLQNSARTSRRLVVVAFSQAQSRAGARALLVADPLLPLPQAWLWHLALLSFSLLSPVSLVRSLSLSLSPTQNQAHAHRLSCKIGQSSFPSRNRNHLGFYQRHPMHLKP
jgi:hypothetical protein